MNHITQLHGFLTLHISNSTSMNTVSQSILPSSSTRLRDIPVRYSNRRQAGDTARLLEAFDQKYIGLSTEQSADGKVALVAFATPCEIFVISVETDKPLGLLPSDHYFESLLLGTSTCLVGFEMAKLGLRLHRDLKIPVRGIDLSTLFSPNTRDPWRPSKFIESKISPLTDKAKFDTDNLWNSASDQGNRNVCLRAWLSACAAEGCVTTELKSALQVDTRLVFDKELDCLGELLRQADLLEGSKPAESPNEFSKAKLLNNGHISLQNSRYRTRVRQSRQTAVILTSENGREFFGRAKRAVGKTTTIKLSDQAFSGNVQNVRVVGRQELTQSEKARDEFLLSVLQGQKTLRNSTFIRKLWFPSPRKRRSNKRAEDPVAPSPLVLPQLNQSQIGAVSAMISEEPLVIVHGPPGTGKTTAISEAASIWLGKHIATWMVAHSNVAVKNIAEKLFMKNVDFRILVSKDFHFEWHEHLYERIQAKLIRSDELPDDLGELERSLGDTCIMLSTLSMLSNPALDDKGVFRIIPVIQLVVDEASQINVYEFMHIFERHKDLKKVCFFGDPQQLPPYGKDKVPELQTIFDLENVRGHGKFLNVQYRMPVPLGQFISHHVYGGKLQSEHKLNSTSCLSFIDTSNSEEEKSGFSWKNQREIQTVVHLVRSYYQNKNFCVITPYDAQRAAIEAQLKSENLPWERVFNVDSFQGNEADYVLISVVRSSNPGFLTSLQRMNVMLTRCRAGLVIVTSRSFLRGGGERTLLGELAKYWDDLCNSKMKWPDWRLVAGANVDLPGSLRPVKVSELLSLNSSERMTVQQPQSPSALVDGREFGTATSTSFIPQARGVSVVPRPRPGAGPAFASVSRPSWAQAASGFSPRTSVLHQSTNWSQSRSANYASYEKRSHWSTLDSSQFPVLNSSQSWYNLPMEENLPARQARQRMSKEKAIPPVKRVGLGKTPVPVKTPDTTDPVPSLPQGPESQRAVVERISSRVIRITRSHE